MSKVLLVDWSADFAMDNEHGKLKRKETTNDLARFISPLNPGSEESHIEGYVQLARVQHG